MPLPQPIYPSFRPLQFADNDTTINRALEIYAKYNPAAMQQRLYQTMLEDEQFQRSEAQKRIAMLEQERARQLQNLSRFRETGLGPSGRAGGAGGTRRAAGRGGAAGVRGDLAELAGVEVRRNIASSENTTEAMQAVDRQYLQLPGGYGQFLREFEAQVVDKARRGGGTVPTASVVEFLTEGASADNLRRLSEGVQPDPVRNRVLASQLYGRLLANFPSFFRKDASGKVNQQGLQLAFTIDRAVGSEGFLLQSLLADKSPFLRLDEERQAKYAGIEGIGPDFFERTARKLVLDADGDGTVTPEEQSRFDEEMERRKALGISEPLSVEEQAFLGRYVDALRDDGVATREELGDDYDQALAAYQKGALAERLPRGTSAFYDEGYLRSLGRLSEIDTELGELSGRLEGSPAARAAQRTLGLPRVPQEALEAAAAVNPMAAEVLPYALKRVSDGAGQIVPQSRPERFAQDFIEATQGPRDFNAIVRAVNKRYPNDPVARRDALAYYGAYHYDADTKRTTLSTGMQALDFDQVADEAAAFQDEVAGERAAVTQALPEAPQLAAPPDMTGLTTASAFPTTPPVTYDPYVPTPLPDAPLAGAAATLSPGVAVNVPFTDAATQAALQQRAAQATGFGAVPPYLQLPQDQRLPPAFDADAMFRQALFERGVY